MKDSDWICKRCGSTDIVAEVSCRFSTEVSGRIREGDGKPRLDIDTFGLLDDDDLEILGYICECGASHAKFEELVVRRRAFNERRLPCGHCDHGADAHPAPERWITKDEERRGLVRPLMPCTVAGCDCHDYYDQALGLTPNWDLPERQMAITANASY